MTGGPETVVRVPNAVVLIGDRAGDVPETMEGSLTSATSTCVAVGTVSDANGETRLRLIDRAEARDLPRHLAFDGRLEMPTHRLTIASVLDEVYFERVIEDTSVHLQVWVDDSNEPSDVCVVMFD